MLQLFLFFFSSWLLFWSIGYIIIIAVAIHFECFTNAYVYHVSNTAHPISELCFWNKKLNNHLHLHLVQQHKTVSFIHIYIYMLSLFIKFTSWRTLNQQHQITIRINEHLCAIYSRHYYFMNSMKISLDKGQKTNYKKQVTIE